MRALIVVIIIFFSFSAHAEKLVCPDEDGISLTKNIWEKHFSGPLQEVTLSRIFGGKEISSIVSCRRSLGFAKIWMPKSCRLIAGEGRMEVMSTTSTSEMFNCHLPDFAKNRTLYYDNNLNCAVECN